MVHCVRSKNIKTMLKKIANRVLAHRHFWREASFDELSELYISMMMRSFALGIIGIFIPVFLLKSGFDISQIAAFFIMFFGSRIVADVLGGFMVAKLGPKHTMLVSYAVQIISATLFLTLHMYHWPLVWLAITWGAANSLFFIAFHVDFSKVKHTVHGGKELGYVNAMDRIGSAIGPIAGGLIAVIFGPQYMFLLAVVFLLLGLIPLFRTAEPVRVNQHLSFKALPKARIRRDLFSYMALTVEQNLSIILWPLFLALFVIGDDVYLKLGGLVSLGFLVSILSAYFIGKLVDDKKGKLLLRVGSTLNALLHFFRPLVTTIPAAAIVSVINEIVTVSYRIPYHKGMYDAADHLPGHRIVYIMIMEATGSVAKLFIWVMLYILTLSLGSKEVFVVGFVFAGLASLLIMTEKFKGIEYAKN